MSKKMTKARRPAIRQDIDKAANAAMTLFVGATYNDEIDGIAFEEAIAYLTFLARQVPNPPTLSGFLHQQDFDWSSKWKLTCGPKRQTAA